MLSFLDSYFFFFFNDTATTEIYTLSLHDALPICRLRRHPRSRTVAQRRQLHAGGRRPDSDRREDRKSTRLNSSHLVISYAVFCLKKKKRTTVRKSKPPLIDIWLREAIESCSAPPS